MSESAAAICPVQGRIRPLQQCKRSDPERFASADRTGRHREVRNRGRQGEAVREDKKHNEEGTNQIRVEIHAKSRAS